MGVGERAVKLGYKHHVHEMVQLMTEAAGSVQMKTGGGSVQLMTDVCLVQMTTKADSVQMKTGFGLIQSMTEACFL